MNAIADEPTARSKYLGELIREGRQKSQKSLVECSEILGIPPDELEQYETGIKAISLPELEVLAYTFQIPLNHFIENPSEKVEGASLPTPIHANVMRLRHKMIGAGIRQARIEKTISLQEMADRLELGETRVESYELGMEKIPLPILEDICGIVNRSIKDFQDQKGAIGLWNTQQQAIGDFINLPLELQNFITKPVNRPYLDLAIRLSKLSVERLRAVAEGLLEITY